MITADAEAYAKVAAAMKLPRDNDVQKKSSAARCCRRLSRARPRCRSRWPKPRPKSARLSLPAAEKGNPNAVSDAGVAVVLAEAAAQAAALNVKINLAWIEDDEFKRDTWTRIEAAFSETARLRETVLALTYSKI